MNGRILAHLRQVQTGGEGLPSTTRHINDVTFFDDGEIRSELASI